MRVTVKLFGGEADAVGRREVTIEIAGDTASCAELARRLVAAEPRLRGRIDRCRLAVNHEFADAARRIAPGDEVALIGMVSGG
jgi:molybdopterin converting factor small subunit